MNNRKLSIVQGTSQRNVCSWQNWQILLKKVSQYKWVENESSRRIFAGIEYVSQYDN